MWNLPILDERNESRRGVNIGVTIGSIVYV
jgi:hypothetical protein